MIRSEYIDEIKKYILSAKIEKVYNADFIIKNEEELVSFPTFDEVLAYINKAVNSDKFFHNLYKTLNEYKEYTQNNKVRKQTVLYAPLSKRIKFSENTISELVSVFEWNINFEKIPDHKVFKYTIINFSDEHSDSLNFLYDSLVKLADKVKNYIKVNSIYSTAYKINFENRIKFNKEDASKTIFKVNEDIKKILGKVYIPDFLSDGSDDLKEMMLAFWNGLCVLLHYTNPKENESYSVDDEPVKNIKDYFKNELNGHYLILDSYLSSLTLFDTFDDQKIKSKYEKLIKIKIPRVIQPKTELDLTSKKTRAELKLEALIGLTPVKEMVEKIKAYVKANKGGSDLNIHMCFRGNPGTGKTEVGKLMGEILYENGILPTKKFTKVTKTGLVSQYLNETGPKTAAVIKDHIGGTLLIDEAYELASPDNPHDFGHEAVTQLINDMDEYRGKMCIILAGYTNKMDEMISTNPGFKDRIQFYIDFPDYSRDEMEEMLALYLEEKGYAADEQVMNRMLDIIDLKRKEPNFANGRVARNVLEQCIMNQNLRRIDQNDKAIIVDDVNKYINDAKIDIPTSVSNKTNILTGEEELEQLIGLMPVKMMIKKIKAYAKKNKGSPNLNLNMAFIGNPGTGKSEVARIISRILFEAGVLPEAKVILGNRSTLVGEYLGTTDKKTRQAVENALGGVLFIDEVYSLTSDISSVGNGFGKEAVDALVDEMEKNRGKLSVVIAGYEKDVNKLFALNTGLKGRFQFVVNFPDYSRNELRQITLLMLAKEDKPYAITNDALERLLDIIEFFSATDPEYANARTLRNVISDIIMNQNARAEDIPDDYKIIVDDVKQYTDEHGLLIKTKNNLQKSLDLKQYIDYLNAVSFEYDASKTDTAYYESAVVSISGEDNGQGTGFVIAPNGLCLTCNHCISEGSKQKARVIFVLNDGQKLKNYVDFEILYLDSVNDIALIRLQDTGVSYKYIPLAFEKDIKYEPLQEFIMAGFPFGGESFSSISITEGKIASLNFYKNRRVVFADMFGKPGNSGSPIIDKISKKAIGVFWGGIVDSCSNEMIPCFAPIDEVWKKLKS